MSPRSSATSSRTSRSAGRPACCISGKWGLTDILLGAVIPPAGSLKYHRLHPEYIHQRIEKLGHMYNLRVLLIVCDIVSTNAPRGRL